MKKFISFILAVIFFLPVVSWGQTNYYSAGNNDATLTSSWWSNTNGTGTNPSNFTTTDQVFNVQNGHSMTASAAWTVSGANSKVVIKTGGKISTGAFSHTLTLDMESGAEYQVEHTAWGSVTAGTWDNNSTVSFTNNGIGLRTINHPSVDIKFTSGQKSISNGTSFTILGNLTVTSGTLNIVGNSGSIGTLNIGGALTINGGTLSTGTGTGNLNFTNSGLASGNITVNSGTLTLGSGDADAITISASRTAGLNSNIAINSGSTFLTNGTLNCGTGVISGAGTFTLSSGATLGIGSADGITSSGSTGNIQTTTRNFDTAAKYTYNGSSAQVTGNGLPASVNTLTINNSNGVTLTSGVNVTDYLTMTSGNITLNDQSLILGTAASAANKGSLTWSYGTSGYMVGGGSFTRWADTNEGGIFFPFGTATQRRSLQIYGTPTTGGTVSATYSDASGATSLSFTDNSMSFDKRSNLSWIIGIANGFVASGLTMTISPYSMPGVTNVSDLTLCISSGTAPGTYAVPFGSNDPVLDLDRTGLASGDIGGVTFYVGAKAASALPVQLTSFTALLTNNGVHLNWETATEVNNYGFEVERQEAVGNWQKVGFVNGHGNSNSPKSYTFIDATTPVGKVQYRLKQIDFDGKFEYSNVIEVNIESPASLVLYQNSPNPFNPTTEIKFALPKSSEVELSVYNMLGEKVGNLLSGLMNAGEHKVNFDASNLSSGVYFYKLTTDNNVTIRKMILMK